jgi:UDP:flavonoid glycosyltransferase YjiC (YdhE family)
VTHVRPSGRVVIALGGGVHVRRSGAAIAAAVAAAVPGIRINLATGFALGGRQPSLPAGCRWVHAPNGLAALLASASVAVVAGGLTLYEACALGTPAVAVPVVPAQRAAIRAMASARAVVAVRGGGRDRTLSPSAVASSVAALLANPATAAELGRRARQLVDGGGATRAAARLRQLLGSPKTGDARHA